MTEQNLKNQLQAQQQRRPGTAVAAASPQQQRSLVSSIADRYGVDPDKLLYTLKQTAFRQRQGDPEPNNAEMFALLVVCDQYKLNPFTKEIYAFLDKKRGGIVPVVSVDGWDRIVNEHPECDGFNFKYSESTVEHKGKVAFEWMEVEFYRKDRTRPTIVREFFDEVARKESFATPWDSHPKRMHRHKVFIQGARMAYGFAGIYDEDEAQRIVGDQISGDYRETQRQQVVYADFTDTQQQNVGEQPRDEDERGDQPADNEGSSMPESGAQEAPADDKPKITYAQVMQMANAVKTAEDARAVAQACSEMPADHQKELNVAAAKALAREAGKGAEQIGSKGVRRSGNLE